MSMSNGAEATALGVISDDESVSWEDPGAQEDSDEQQGRIALRGGGRPRFCPGPRCAALTFIAMLASTAVLLVAVVFSRPALANRPNTAIVLGSEIKNASAACPDFPWKNIRLPSALTPNQYDLRLQPNLSTFVFEGTATIKIEVREATDLLVLHSKALEITTYRATVEGSNDLIKEMRVCDELELLTFELDRNLTVGESLSLVISYVGNITSDLLGLYKNTFRSKDRISYAAVTQFEPTDARRMFPCFDEPAFKAVFKISIVRESRHYSLSNMKIDHTETLPDGIQLDSFAPTVKMSTYLVAIVVCDFETITGTTSNKVRVSVHVPQEQIREAEYALETAIKGLEYLESFFNITFPLPKQDLIGLSDFSAGAMENWGLITFRDTLLLYNQNLSSIQTKELVATVISHELAHQWFGNLVTMKWWNDLWLNEGFASFTEYLITDKIHPDWKILDSFYFDNVAPGLYLDALITSHPISVPVEDPAEIASIFDAISYQKGASIINMVMGLVGEDKFRAGLQEYLKTYQYKNAEGADLWNVLEKHMNSLDGVTLAEVARAWTTQVGYPLIQVSIENQELVVLNQTRFIYLHSERSGHQNNVWPIHLSYKSDIGNGSFWMRNGDRVSEHFKERPKWLLLNAGGTGFYRTLYSRPMYDALRQQLNTNHLMLTAAERTSLLYDSFSLLKAGLVDVETVFNLLDYLSTEDSRAPWRILTSQLSGIENIIFETDYLPTFQKFVRFLIKDIYERLGWKEQTVHRRKLLQSEILSYTCQIKIPECIEAALQSFRSWRENSESVTAELKALVVSSGVRYGNQSDWDLVYNRYLNTHLPAEKSIFLKALASSNDPWLLNRLLLLTLDSHVIKSNLMSRVVGYVSDNPIGRPLAWRFVRAHWTQITEALGPTSLIGSLVKATIQDFATDFDYNEAKEFFAGKDLGKSQKRLEQTLETIRINVQWLSFNQDQLKDWLMQWKARQT